MDYTYGTVQTRSNGEQQVSYSLIVFAFSKFAVHHDASTLIRNLKTSAFSHIYIYIYIFFFFFLSV